MTFTEDETKERGPDSLETPLDDGVKRLGAELYYAKLGELLEHPAESSVFAGHEQLLSAEYSNRCDSVRYATQERRSLNLIEAPVHKLIDCVAVNIFR